MRTTTLRRLIGLATVLVLVPVLASAQTLDNQGKEFITSFNPNPIDGPPIVEVHLTTAAATDVTVEYPVNSPTFSTTVAVAPGAITVVELPPEASTGWTTGQVGNNAVRLSAAEEFVAYTINRLRFTSDAALALPIETFNTDYIVATYTATFQSQFTVVAAFDDTEVTITPSQNLRGGATAGTPFVVTLDRGEGFLGEAAGRGTGGDLTGTLVEATKPVGMTNGNYCVNVPPGTAACDHVYEVAQPLASWGDRVFVAPLPQRPSGSVYRIIAGDDNTPISQDGASIGTFDKGEFHDTGVIPGAHVFSADGPIFVVQYMTGDSFAGADDGDPAMGNLAPSEQYLSAYTFSTIAGAFQTHYLSVIAEDDDVSNGTILLDGAPIPAGDFTAIGSTGFSYAVLELDEGTHSTASDGVHGITVQGYNPFNSYIYPGGAQFNFINQGDDLVAPNCDGSRDGDTFAGSAEDLLSTDPDNTGIFFVVLSDDSANLVLDVDDFTPGAETVSYRVSLDDLTVSGSGTVVVTDGAGNQCRTPVSIVVDGQTTLACTIDAPLSFDADGSGSNVEADDFSSTGNESVGIRNEGDALSVDLSACTFVSFDPFDEDIIYTLGTTGTVTAADTYVLATSGGDQNFGQANVLTDSPGAFALVQGSATVGDDFSTLLIPDNRIVAAVVYDRDRSVFGSIGGGATDAERRAFAEVLASIQGAAVAEEGNGMLNLELVAAPNPISGRGTVSFGLAESSDVTVALYDALGRRVSLVTDAPYGPGRHTVGLDASALPTGVYVVRVMAEGEARTTRLTVVR